MTGAGGHDGESAISGWVMIGHQRHLGLVARRLLTWLGLRTRPVAGPIFRNGIDGFVFDNLHAYDADVGDGRGRQLRVQSIKDTDDGCVIILSLSGG